jgi:hypothetical protein
VDPPFSFIQEFMMASHDGLPFPREELVLILTLFWHAGVHDGHRYAGQWFPRKEFH